ncbi:MAG: DUF4199 domain-containing protein [Flavobacteriales bacterium]
MRKIVLIFGLIAGIIPGAIFFISNPGGEIDMENGMIIGYAAMLLAFSTIIFAVRQYRDNYSDGSIKFGKAFLIGLYITLIASVLYSVAWETYTTVYDLNFAEHYQEYIEKTIAESGKSEEAIAAEIAESAEMMEMYQNNFLFRFGMTMMEIFPVGLLISLICALVFGVIMKPKSTEAVA